VKNSLLELTAIRNYCERFVQSGRHIDYPYAIEHDGRLLVAFTSGKQSVEALMIRLVDLKPIAN
jgi:hypothetical protein